MNRIFKNMIGFLASARIATCAAAQGYPSKAITIIVPFPAGGAVDALIRPIAQYISDKHKVPVLVDNRVGAGGNIGTAATAKSAPDGYTLVAGTVGTHVINGLLSRDIGYNVNSFRPITANAIVPNVLLVGPAVTAKNVRELIDVAKQSTQKLDYASAGTGSPSHLAGELFASQAKVTLVHVPYKGAPPVVADLISGRVAMFFNNLPSSLPLIESGKVRALAVTTRTRSPSLPDVPTMKEAGLPDFEVNTWYGIFAPAGTSDAVVAILSRDIRDALKDPAISTSYKTQGAIVIGNTPAEFEAMIVTDRAIWSQVIKAAGIKATD